ncbi:MAG TPA: hypothetical protein VFX59_18730, partial [Polyangiales bacterium]|nr:hypothetical protein [Polyangiales bacterium]
MSRTAVRGVLASALLGLSGCFLTGYEPMVAPVDDAEAGPVEVPDASAVVDGRARDADGLDTAVHDAGEDAAELNTDEAGAQADYDAELPREDAGADADVGDADAESDAGDAGSVDAGQDAAVDAGSDADLDAGFDAGVDAGRDAGRDASADACGQYGCVAVTPCTGSACDLTCNEVPDPDNSATLDCQFECNAVQS